jgi:hypothetical protein
MDSTVVYVTIAAIILVPLAALILRSITALPQKLPSISSLNISIPRPRGAGRDERGRRVDNAIKALFNTIGGFSDRLRALWEAWRLHQSLSYETVVVYDNIIIHRVLLPAAEIVPFLDHRSRWVPDKQIYYVLGMAGGFLVVFGLAFWFWSGRVPPGAYMISGTFSMFFGAILGAPLGWWIGPKLGPAPFWVMRRLTDYTEVLDDPSVPDGPSTTVGETRYESVIHQRFTEPEYEIQKRKDEDGNSNDIITPQVFRATSMGESTEHRDERDFYRGAGKGIREKVELAMMVTVLLCLAGLLFLFATSQGG